MLEKMRQLMRTFENVRRFAGINENCANLLKSKKIYEHFRKSYEILKPVKISENL